MANTRRTIFRFTVALLFGCAVISLSVYFVYANFIDTFTKKTSLFVLPSSVSSPLWKNTDSLYFQDLRESALYQNFTKKNSAYLDISSLTTPPTAPQATTPSGATNPSPIPAETSPPATSSSTIDTQAGSGVGEASSSVPVVVPPAPEPTPAAAPEPIQATPPPVPEPTPASAPVSLLHTVTGKFAFLTALFDTTSSATIPTPESTPSVPPVPALPTFAPPTDVATTSSSTPEVSNPTVSPTPTAPEPTQPSPVVTPKQNIATTSATLPLPDATSTSEGNTASTSATTTSESIPSDPNRAVTFTGFAIPSLASGETIQNAQIRMSFAAQRSKTHTSTKAPELRVEYTFGVDDTWQNAGTVVIDDEVSNALNGGYFLFALPPIIDPKDLRKLKVRAVYVGDYADVEQIYIDSLWVEVNAMTLDRAALDARVSPDALTDLEKPKMHELLSNQLDFTEGELPHFAFKYIQQRNFAVRFIRSIFSSKVAEVKEITFVHTDAGEIKLPVNLNQTADGLWTVQLTEEARQKLIPGTYKLKIDVNEGGVIFKDELQFQWGLIAINSNKTRYSVGENAEISLGALSPGGNTLCDADLELYIIDATQFIRRLPVNQSGQCNGNNHVLVPDYSAQYSIAASGTYELYVEHVAPEGNVLSHTSMTFEVADSVPFSLARSGPTRIFPVDPYDMSLVLQANDAVHGTLIERVPKDYVITDTTAKVEQLADTQTLTWDIDIPAGGERTFKYRFDSPDISPYLYELGPATIQYKSSAVPLTSAASGGASASDTAPLPPSLSTTTDTTSLASSSPLAPSTPVSVANTTSASTNMSEFTEHRKWQVASDATGSMVVFWADGTTIPAGWTCVSCTATSTFYQKFIRGGSTYGVTGGVSTSSHTANASMVASSTAANGEANVTTLVTSDQAHTHTLPLNIIATSTIPRYRQLRLIQYNSAGEPASLPAGAIMMFDSAPPSGWANYTPENGYYPRGDTAVGTTGGSNTHRHDITGTTSAANATNYNGRGGGAQVSNIIGVALGGHTHTISTTTDTVSNEPAYTQVILATTTTATSVPINAIAMWTDTQPAGWLDESSASSGPFYNSIIKASSTYTTGGSDTHTHADIFGATTTNPNATSTGRTGTVGAMGNHQHQFDITNFSTDSHVPPYVTVIVAKHLGFVPVFTQTYYRWFVNSDAEPPTDPWPSGVVDLDQNESIDSTSTPVKNGDVIRLRLGLNVLNSTSTNDTFKLQYGTTTSDCTAVPTWADVGSVASSTAWKGYDNGSVTDGATLSSTTLTGTNAKETYQENYPTAVVPNQIGIGQNGEWDFVLTNNGADAGAYTCFRMVKSDGTALFAYNDYPKLYTNNDPGAPTLTKLFDNEKVATTSPQFEFSSADDENNDITYQIQIDDDPAFGSVNVDKRSDINTTQFVNVTTPADKDPFNAGETVRFSLTSSLTNGTTYYWRVRAKDPTGSNAFGPWATSRSFTIDTSLTANAWFQTKQAQFDTDTLESVVTSPDQVSLIVGSTTGTTTGSEIDFSNGTIGNAWQSLSWNDTKTSASIFYHIEYKDVDGNWALIPDADLNGNSTGFSSSPVNLLGLDTGTYGSIRIRANMTNSGSVPSIQDWTVLWGFGISAPVVSKLLPNEKISSNLPAFEFTATDPQSDSLVYEFQWSTSSDFSASTTRTSSSSAGFENTVTPADTTPFNSGQLIRYTIQPSDRMASGTTYWFHVRAIDPGGSNFFSSYSDVQSFTIATTTISQSTWFQTTGQQFNTDTLTGTTIVSTTSLSVATTASEAMIVYGEGNVVTPKYRVWNGTSWGTQQSAQSVGATVRWTVTKESATREEYLMGTLGSDGAVNVQVYSNGSWGHLQKITGGVPDTNARGFDITYENASGTAMVVSCDGDADPTYYTWDGTTWTNGGTVNLASVNNCAWVKLISKPNSNEIILVSRDSTGSQYEAQVWNGTAWGNSTTWGSMTEVTHEGIAAAYEDSGNQAVVAVSNGNNASFLWRAWNGSAWSASTAQALNDDFEVGTLAHDQGTDNMALCYVDNLLNVGVIRWTGAAWTGQTRIATTSSPSKVDRTVDCAYETSSGRDGFLMAAYASNTRMYSRVFNGTSWLTEAPLATIYASSTVQLARTASGTILMTGYDSAHDKYMFSTWNGSSWSTQQTLETDSSVGAIPYKQPFMMAPRKNANTTGSAVVSPQIDFNTGSGPAWRQLSWTDTEPGTSTLLYQVEYYHTASSSWDLIPDSVIPGNSVGTTTSPINLANVLPVTTYRYIRPVANFTCNLSFCPTLNDWTVTWAAGINISGTAQQYNRVGNISSGTVSVAVNGVLQTGRSAGISGTGTWTIPNVNVTTGDVVTVFIDGAIATDEAVGVTKYDGTGDITGINLFQRHVSIGSDDNATITNADLSYYTGHSYIFHSVSGGTLTVCSDVNCGDANLIVKAGNTYQPGSGANVNTYNFINNGTFVPNGNTIRVSGSYFDRATSTMGSSTIIMTATTSLQVISQTGTSSGAFYNLTLGETSGVATWNASTSATTTGNFNVTYGTYARATTTLVVSGNLTTGANGFWTGIGTTTLNGATSTTWTDSNATKQDIGNLIVDGTAKTVTMGSNVLARTITIGADDTLDASASNYNLQVLGSWTNNNSFVARSGSVSMVATSSGKVIDAGTSSFYDLTFSGANGAWSFTRPTLTVGNNFTVSTGTVTMPTATTTVTGSWNTTGGTFVHNNGLILFNTSGSQTITLAGGNFTNTLYDVVFNGSGSWSFVTANATTSNNFKIIAGAVTLPSGTLALGASFLTSGGSFVHNSGTVKFTSGTGQSISQNSSALYNVLFTGAGAFTFTDTNVTLAGSTTISAGSVILPTGTTTIGGSFINTAGLNNSNGTVQFNGSTLGNTVNIGTSTFYNITFNGPSGGWTIPVNATATNAFNLANAKSFTQASGTILTVSGIFTNNVGGASTTWATTTLALIGTSTYTINSKASNGDLYNILSVGSSTKVSMWNSSSTNALVSTSSAYLYSQNHNAVNGSLYIFGAYVRTSGTENWSAATDFDGTAIATSSQRAVSVRFAASSTAVFSSSTLSIVGTSTATTTITDQAATGTYLLSISFGTTTASYYSFAGMATSGVTIGTSTKVTSLGNGSYTVGVVGGTGLTVASTSIDLNPGLQIYSVNFATTSAIAATNVTQTGGAPASYWWFRSATGNLQGEAKDNDTGNPGSIRWDDSSYSITVSGKVYSDIGVTPLGAPTCDSVTNNVRLVVASTTLYDTSCSNVDGSYSFAGVTFIGSPVITVFLNTNGGQQGTRITKTPTGNIAGLDIYTDYVVVTEQDVSQPMTIADMSGFTEANDTDVRFVAASTTFPNTLTVRPRSGLLVATSSVFTPNGNITLTPGGNASSSDGTLHIDNNATFNASGTEAYSVGGRFQVDAGGVFNSASSTVTFTATTTGKTISSPGTITFNSMQFASSGQWVVVANLDVNGSTTIASGTVTGSGNIDLKYGMLTGSGTLALSGGTTTVERTNTLGGNTPWTFYNLLLGTSTSAGTTTRGGTATDTVLGQLTINSPHIFAPGGSLWDLSGTTTPFSILGTFTAGTSTVRYSASSSANITSATYYNLDLNASTSNPTYTAIGSGILVNGALSIGGFGSTTVNFDTSDPPLTVTGTTTINPKGTLIGSNSAAFSANGSWFNTGVYTPSGGTVTFGSSGSTTIAAGNSAFSTVILNGTGAFNLTQSATATVAFTLTQVGTFTVNTGTTLAVGGTFANNVSGALTNWASSTLALYGGGNYQINASTTADRYSVLYVASSTNIRMWNASATTTIVATTSSLYSQNNAGVNGALYIYGNYSKTSGTDYWSYATDFDGTPLSGGSLRATNVFFANNATATYSGGNLEVAGVSTATSTIQNQGSGTYSLIVGAGASTTMRYYQLRNMDASGLVLTGSTSVNSLSNGDILVAQAGGSGITVGGSVINQNPAKTINGMRFATSSAISAFNVTATGTSVSSWRFTNHTGNIAGEAFDNDPAGDPGYLVWADSNANITISGHVYSDEGVTVSSVCNGASTTVRLVVQGITSYSTTCAPGTGLYTIPNVSYGTSDTLTLYLDTNGGVKGSTVMTDPTASTTNSDIYENRVIVRHENTNPITIAKMALWDSTQDTDIPFTAVDATNDTLTLPANTKLIVWTGKTFQPNGNISLAGGGAGAAYDGTLELYANSTFTAGASESHSIGGSLISDAGAVFTPSTSSFVFTTTGANRIIDTNNAGFYDVTFNGSGGSWTVTDAPFLVANNYTETTGAVTLPSATTTVGGSFAVNGGSFYHSSGTIALSATASGKTVKANGSSFNHLVFTGIGGGWSMTDTNATVTAAFNVTAGAVTLPSGVLSVGSFFSVATGTITHNSGTIKLMASTTNTTFKTSGSDVSSLYFAGSGSYIMQSTNVAALGNITIATGSVTFATGTLSIGGSLIATSSGSFNNASGAILFNASATGKVVSPATSTFNNVSFGSGSGGWTLTQNATSTGNFTLSSASAFTVASGTTLVVKGVFTNLVGGAATTWDGSTLFVDSNSGYTINTSAAGGDRYNILRIGTSTYLRAWNSSATSTLLTASSSLYSQNNAGVSGDLYIYGNYSRTTGADYWDYATDFDGTTLSGVSRRAVTVRYASSATSTFTGGTLEIVGAAGATTTVTNQGSGTYDLAVQNATFNAQYYAMRNMDASGLQLLGTTTVTTLANGDFELAVAGGTTVTVASTTLDQNPAVTYGSVRFATTTAITGFNVTLLGSSANAWTFTADYGNLTGEAHDVDGATACGSIRFDDSSCLIIAQTQFRWRNDDGGESAPTSEWYNASWTKRKRVVIRNSDAQAYTNAVVKVTVPYASSMLANFNDLRFTNASGTTLLNHWKETNTATSAVVWVKVPTLAASGDTSVYMYYGNGSATDASSGTSTFEVFDDFEDNNINEYSGDTSLFGTSASFAYDRTYGLATVGNENAQTTNGIYVTSSTTQQGKTIRYFQYVNTTAGASDESCTLFGVQSPGTLHNNYAVCLALFGADRVTIAKDVSSNENSGTVLATSTATFVTGWHEVSIDWKTNNTISVTVSKNGVVIGSVSTSDATYTSGGIGFSYWFQHGGWDDYTSRPYLTTTPTVRFGAEQVSGGASWLAAQNVAATNITPSSTERIRFVIDNTGTAQTNKQFRLEFAPKGASPNCEAVPDASYAQVLPRASCGLSAICMATSTNITDLSSTTDQIGGAGTFTYGQIMKDSSNKTNGLNISQSYSTEVEYVISPSGNASSSAYCLRATDNGTVLDSYSRVAEMRLKYDPVITNVILNNGSDIILSPGATTTITATATITDNNGYADIQFASSTLYRSGVGSQCTADNNNCYRVSTSTCSLSNCSGNSCTASCSASVYYYADATDIGTYSAQNWLSSIFTVDSTGTYASSTGTGVEMLTLRALAVLTSSINYGSVAVLGDTGSYNATTTVQNLGNDRMDISISGTDLTYGGISTIPVGQQKFSTTTFTYTGCTTCNLLATTATPLDINILKPTTTTAVTGNAYWGIAIPFGVAGAAHQGSNTFYAIANF